MCRPHPGDARRPHRRRARRRRRHREPARSPQAAGVRRRDRPEPSSACPTRRRGRAVGRSPARLRGRSLRNYTLLLVVAWCSACSRCSPTASSCPSATSACWRCRRRSSGLASISAVMLIVTRNFDLSVGSAVALVGVVARLADGQAGTGTRGSASPWPSLAGIALGAWNAGGCAKVGVSSFIVTLAGMMIFRGVSLIITDGATVAPVPATLTEFAAGYLATLPVDRCSSSPPSAPTPSFTMVVGASGARRFGLDRRLAQRCVRSLMPGALAAAAGHLRVARRGHPLPAACSSPCCALRGRDRHAPHPLRRAALRRRRQPRGRPPVGHLVRRVVFIELRHRRLLLWHHRRRPDGPRQRRHRRHAPGCSSSSTPSPPRSSVAPASPAAGARILGALLGATLMGSAQQRHEPAEHRHLLPADRPRLFTPSRWRSTS